MASENPIFNFLRFSFCAAQSEKPCGMGVSPVKLGGQDAHPTGDQGF
jgi:hypothetical protein